MSNPSLTVGEVKKTKENLLILVNSIKAKMREIEEEQTKLQEQKTTLNTRLNDFNHAYWLMDGTIADVESGVLPIIPSNLE